MSGTITYTDQNGREVEIPKEPQRVISLVPSQTELLYNLGLEKRVVGITKFCIHPEEWFKTKTRVGGTKQLHFDIIGSLNPDLIIANKEENNRADVERLQSKFPVWVSDVSNLASAIEMINHVADITASDASTLTEEIQSYFSTLKPIFPTKKALYLIWKNPYMAVGTDTFINDMLYRCGFENGISKTRYPELSEEEIAAIDPELILLSSEPFPFGETHIQDLQELLPNAKIVLVDGEMFSWYGSRIKLAPSYFSELIGSIVK